MNYKFGVWTRKERKFLNADDQERGQSVHEPEGGASSSNFVERILDRGIEELSRVPPDSPYVTALITRNFLGDSILLTKNHNVYSLGFFFHKTQTETYNTLGPRGSAASPSSLNSGEDFLAVVLQKVNRLGKIQDINLVTAEQPVNENVSGQIVKASLLYRGNSFGKKSKFTLNLLNKEIVYLNSI
jgi:hypothetical protein